MNNTIDNTKQELKKKDIDEVSSGVFEELLKSPLVKNILRENLNSLNENDAKKLIKTALWTDPELTLSSLAVLPSVINATSTALLELDKELEEKISDKFLSDYLEQLLKQINTENLKELFNRSLARTTVITKAASIHENDILEYIKGPLAIELGKQLNTFIQYINNVQKNENAYFSELASNIFSQVNKEELNKAIGSISTALFKHIPDVFQWTSKALGDNLLGRFGIKF